MYVYGIHHFTIEGFSELAIERVVFECAMI